MGFVTINLDYIYGRLIWPTYPSTTNYKLVFLSLTPLFEDIGLGLVKTSNKIWSLQSNMVAAMMAFSWIHIQPHTTKIQVFNGI